MLVKITLQIRHFCWLSVATKLLIVTGFLNFAAQDLYIFTAFCVFFSAASRLRFVSNYYQTSRNFIKICKICFHV